MNINYKIVKKILEDKNIEAYIRLYVLLLAFEKNNRKIWASNQYFASKLCISTSTVKRCLNRLKIDKLIGINNVNSFKRTICIINDDPMVNLNNNGYIKGNVAIVNDSINELVDYNWLDDLGN